MEVKALKTHRIEKNESLLEILDKYVISLKENDVIVITSKIISVCQGRIISKNEISKDILIRQEADAIVQTSHNSYGIYLTLKDNILIPSAGIDESNSEDSYILYPSNIQKTIVKVWKHLRKTHHIQNLGIVISDSHTSPLRRGVTGIALGWCGFRPLYCYEGKTDLYNKFLRITKINLLDSLATTATLVMGEGNEQTPIAIISGAPRVFFLDRIPSTEEIENVRLKMEEDLYAPLLLSAQWSMKVK